MTKETNGSLLKITCTIFSTQIPSKDCIFLFSLNNLFLSIHTTQCANSRDQKLITINNH